MFLAAACRRLRGCCVVVVGLPPLDPTHCEPRGCADFSEGSRRPPEVPLDGRVAPDAFAALFRGDGHGSQGRFFAMPPGERSKLAAATKRGMSLVSRSRELHKFTPALPISGSACEGDTLQSQSGWIARAHEGNPPRGLKRPHEARPNAKITPGGQRVPGVLFLAAMFCV